MKRFACHRLYVSPGECYAKGVAELENDGRVCACFRLEEEISATQWIGGVIVLSSEESLERERGETFQAFVQRVLERAEGTVYAWHIADFDWVREEFTSQSKPVRL
ncbi:hypothetical protein [Phocaeicola sp.]